MINWDTCTIDDIVEERNRIFLIVENLGGLNDYDKQNFFDSDLGIANRHIKRVVEGKFSLIRGIRIEIRDCLERAEQSIVALHPKNVLVLLRIESFSKRDPMDRSKPFPTDVRFVESPFTCEIDTWWLCSGVSSSALQYAALFPSRWSH